MIKDLENKVKQRRLAVKNMTAYNTQLRLDVLRQTDNSKALGRKMDDQTPDFSNQSINNSSNKKDTAVRSSIISSNMRVHSIYSNMMQGEIEREKIVTRGCIDNVKSTNIKQA